MASAMKIVDPITSVKIKTRLAVADGLYPLRYDNQQIAECSIRSSSADAAEAAAGASRTTVPLLRVPCLAASDDTWRMEMKCAFPGLTTVRCCSC